MIVAQLGFELPSQAVAAQMVLRLLCANADPNIPNEVLFQRNTRMI